MPGILARLEFIAGLVPTTSIAISSEKDRLSYTAMLEAVRLRMGWLSEQAANVVALHCSNSMEWVLVDLACQELGIVLLPLPSFFSVSQIRQCLAKAGADTVLSDQAEFADISGEELLAVNYLHGAGDMCAWKVAKHSRALLPQGTQKITFTSGSTGSPKGVCLSLDHQWQVAQSVADVIGIQQPKHLCLLPLSTLLENVAGIYSPLLCAGEVVLATDLERGVSGSSTVDTARLIACIDRVQPDTLILVPELLKMVVHACLSGWQPPTSLQFVAVGGGRVSPLMIKQARQLGLPVYQGYGLSECGSVVALNTQGQDRLDTVGCVLPHCDVLVENGQVVISGAVHLGYMDDPSSWYPARVYTGDLGCLHDGFLSIDGRKKNILVTSFGRNISPEWVESVITSEPFIQQCVVFGDAKPYLAAIICAPLALTDTRIQYWIDQCNMSLPDYARVGAWLRVSLAELRPFMTANGRPRRAAIAEFFDSKIERLYEDGTATLV